MGLVWLGVVRGLRGVSDSRRAGRGPDRQQVGADPLRACCGRYSPQLTGTATGFTELVRGVGADGRGAGGHLRRARRRRSVRRSRKPSRRSRPGALACCMAGGAALSQYVTGQLLGPLTWQQILVVYAMPGLVWAVAFALVVPRPKAGPATGTEDDWRTPPAPPPDAGAVVAAAHRPAHAPALRAAVPCGRPRRRCSSPGSRATCRKRRA